MAFYIRAFSLTYSLLTVVALPLGFITDVQSTLSPTAKLVLSNDTSFALDSRQQNPRFDTRTPLAIVFCANTHDVQTVLHASNSYGVKLSLRSGGHSFAGYAVLPGTVVLDTSQLQDLELDKQSGIVRAGPGVLNQQLFEFLVSHGRRLPNGGCPSVRLGGYILGGGWGVDMRQLGLAIDSLESVTLVLANGTSVTAADTQFSDLFWALRGGGGANFGVSVSYALRTHELPAHKILLIHASWTDVCKGGNSVASLWQAVQSVLIDTSTKWWPLEFSFSLDAYNSLIMDGAWIGPLETGHRQLGEWFADLPLAPSLLTTSETDFISYAWYANKSFHGFPANFWHSGLVTRILPAQFLWTWCKHAQTPHVSIALESLGGVVNTISSRATAYPHRTAFAEVIVQGLFPNASDEEAARRESSRIFLDMQRYLDGVYVNNVDDSLEDWQHEYYGPNLARLAEIKAVVNPNGAFHFPQSIPLNTHTFSSRDILYS